MGNEDTTSEPAGKWATLCTWPFFLFVTQLREVTGCRVRMSTPHIMGYVHNPPVRVLDFETTLACSLCGYSLAFINQPRQKFSWHTEAMVWFNGHCHEINRQQIFSSLGEETRFLPWGKRLDHRLLREGKDWITGFCMREETGSECFAWGKTGS